MEKIPVCWIGDQNPVLIVLPGLTDAFLDAESACRQLKRQFEPLTKKFQVVVIGRRQPLKAGFSLEQMATDVASQIRDIHATHSVVSVVGMSMGGMVAMQLAVYFPELVPKLVLVACAARQSESGRLRLQQFKELAIGEKYQELWDRALHLIFGQSLSNPQVRVVVQKPRMPDFLYSVDACISHDIRNMARKIVCPVDVFGGERDELFTPDSLKELQSLIPQAMIRVIEGGLHGFVGSLRQEVLNHLLCEEF
jgi:pimeloyl-ACP methyl ester carboxylesterase